MAVVQLAILPFTVIRGMFVGASRVANSQRGDEIRALCLEMGIPKEDYSSL